MPERSCETCKHWRPYDASPKLRFAYAKCSSPRRALSTSAVFAETVRGIPDLCGPKAAWWERKKPTFELVEDEPHKLDWEGEGSDEDSM